MSEEQEPTQFAPTIEHAERLGYFIASKCNNPVPAGDEIKSLLAFLRERKEPIAPYIRNGAWLEQVRQDTVEMFSRTSGASLIQCWITKAGDRLNRSAALKTAAVERDKDGHALLAGEKRWTFEQLERDIARLQSLIPFFEGQILDTEGRIKFTETEQSEADFADFTFTRLEYLRNERETLASFEKELADSKEVLRLRQLTRDNFHA
jgi:hypothetical protein